MDRGSTMLSNADKNLLLFIDYQAELFRELHPKTRNK